MEIDFNPGRIQKPESAQPAARKRTKPMVTGTAGAETVQLTPSLKQKLDDVSSVRPEKVAQGKELVSSTTYPPVELLNRIATLLGVHLKH
jgi:hypothetical protein